MRLPQYIVGISLAAFGLCLLGLFVMMNSTSEQHCDKRLAQQREQSDQRISSLRAELTREQSKLCLACTKAAYLVFNIRLRARNDPAAYGSKLPHLAAIPLFVCPLFDV
jgi:hypothetical protein